MRQFLSTVVNYLQTINLEVKNLFEILIIAVILYYAIRWIRDSRTRFIFRGVLVFLLFIGLANLLGLSVISYLFQKALTGLFIALLVIFQPELRKAFEQLGQRNYLFRFVTGGRLSTSAERFDHSVTEELVKGCFAMGRARTGALIVIEREVSLNEFVKTGIELDAIVTGALLINIFEKNTPLHDGAVVMRGRRLIAATCYLPLSANTEINKNLGTRHRAAIGVSEVTDSLTVVVSEESGKVSLASGGQLRHDITADELREALLPFEEGSQERLSVAELVRRTARRLREKAGKGEDHAEKTAP